MFSDRSNSNFKKWKTSVLILVLMECDLTSTSAFVGHLSSTVLILVLIEKTNTQSQRAGGSLYLLANVGNKSGKRKICRKSVFGCCIFQLPSMWMFHPLQLTLILSRRRENIEANILFLAHLSVSLWMKQRNKML